MEHDLLGDKEVPVEAFFGVQTLRGLENFNISGVTLKFFPKLIEAFAMVKEAAAEANCELGLMDPAVKDAIVEELKKQTNDFICLNFANGDMVGHTGIYEAITKAIKAVDSCVHEVVETAKANGYTVIIIADHGNADFAVNADGSPNTAHSLNPVPIILVSDKYKKVNNGILSDVAPTVLSIMGLPIPSEMSGKVLCN